MRNVERQAKALKLAMEAASDIQANPNWDYAHIVASIQGAILDMDEIVGPSPIEESSVKEDLWWRNGRYSMRVERKDRVEAILHLNTPDGDLSYRIFNNIYPFEKLKKLLDEGAPLSVLHPVATSGGLKLTAPEGGYLYCSELRCKKDSDAYRIAEKFLTHVFKNTPLQGTAQ